MSRSSGARAFCLLVALVGCDATDDDEKRRTVILDRAPATAADAAPPAQAGGGLPGVTRMPPSNSDGQRTDAGFDVAPSARDASLDSAGRDGAAGAPLNNPFLGPFLDGGLLAPASFDDAGRDAASSGSVGAPPESDPALIPNTGGSLE